MSPFGYWLAARLCFVCACLALGWCAISRGNLEVAIFIPASCSGSDVALQTVRDTMNNASGLLRPLPASVSYRTFDSCDESVAISGIVNVTSSTNYDIIVGPGNDALCEIAARLATDRQLPMISWLCTDNALQNRDLYTTFSRTVPCLRDISQAVNETLYHFRWKYVVILTMNVEPHVAFANDLHLTLTNGGFQITLYMELSGEATDDEIVSRFSALTPETKGESINGYYKTETRKIPAVL